MSGKFNSFLYNPVFQTLAVFPVGDCRTVHTLVFEDSRQKNWYKGPQIKIDFENDESLVAHVKKNKSLGLKNSSLNH